MFKRLQRKEQDSLYFSLIAGNLAGEKFAGDSILRQTIRKIPKK
jgi:hypothetical protein